MTNAEEYLTSIEKLLSKHCSPPVPTNYGPELNASEELSEQDTGYYQSLIGVLRWIVELGQVDIYLEISMLASCIILP